MKHLKLTLNPLNTTTLPPMSKDVVNQVIFIIIFYRLWPLLIVQSEKKELSWKLKSDIHQMDKNSTLKKNSLIFLQICDDYSMIVWF